MNDASTPNNSDEAESQHQEPDAIAVGMYGVKLKLHTAQVPPAPQTWGELPHRFAQYLRSIAESVVALPAEALIGVRAIVRGISSVPEALRRRLEKANSAIDLAESKK